MGQFFDSRRFLRTPGFAQDGLYDDEAPLPRTSTDDNGNEIALPPRNPLPDDNGMVEGQPLPPRKPIDWMDRIESLPPRPLPAPPSRLRGAMAGFLGAYNPEAGEEIRHPGYKDDVRRWEAEQERLAGQLKMTQGMSQVQANEARRRAEEARALREAATRERTYGQMASDGIRNVNPGDTVGQYRDGSFKPLYTAPPLPPKPSDGPKSLEELRAQAAIEQDPQKRGDLLTRIKEAEGSKPKSVPATLAQYDMMARAKFGDDEDAVKAEVLRLLTEDRDAKLKETKARTEKAERLPREPRPTVDPNDKPPTSAQARVLSFFQRAEQAEQTLKSLEDKMKQKGLVGQIHYSFAPNFLQSDDNQVYRQAQRQFTEARLRKDSGAAIPSHEIENDAKMYFPQPGDGPKAIEAKKKARETILNALKVEAGRAYTQYAGSAAPSAEGGGQNQGPVKMTDGKVTRLVPFEYIKQFEARGYKKK